MTAILRNESASLPEAEPGQPETATMALAVVRALLDRLHGQKLQYCHWKSNEHVAAAVQGLTDLDVLVENGRSDDLQRSLAESGFRRFQATALTAYPAVEDYLGFDEATGRIVHLHLHHRLTLGQKHLKGYRLPWEDEVLASSRLDPQNGIFTSAPEMELLLHLVRDALKLRLRSRLALWLGRASTQGDFAREFAFLVERVDVEAVVALALRLIGPACEASLRRILQDGITSRDRLAFAAAVRPALSRYRTYGAVTASVLMALREMFWTLGGISRRKFHWALPMRRVSPRGGAVVVFLGSDGAGKSTASADAITWLGQKLDVVPIYFGSGDGPSSFLRKPLQIARFILNKGSANPTGPREPRRTWRGGFKGFALVLWALALSIEKRGKLRRMIRARNRGLIVVCDRFAQNQTDGFNDGKLLGLLAKSPSRFVRSLAAFEARPYQDALLDPPDLVIKLIASPGMALARRPDMTQAEIERRIATVRALIFPAHTRVAEIDADQPLDEVLRAVHRLVWKVL